jgi:hypothetical protein
MNHFHRRRSAAIRRQPKGSAGPALVGLLAVMAGAALSLTLVTSPAGAAAPAAHGSTPGVATVAAATSSLGSASVLSPSLDRAHSTSGRTVQTHDVDPICTFNGQSAIITNVTPGSSIAIACTGWEANDEVAVGQASPLAFGPDGTSDDIDPNVSVLTADANGSLTGTFVVPNPFSAPDPNAVCPPTPAQVSQGFLRCALVLADQDENGGLVALNYSSAPAAAGTSAVGMASTPDGQGYWVAWANGAVTNHGDALNCGDASQLHLAQPITHIVSTPDGDGFWLVAADGGTFTFGDAGFFGSMGGQHLNAPVVDIAPTHDGGGYWLVASDGGIFSFGDAAFKGSMGGQHLNQPVVGIAADYATGGYWMVATDGGIFSFGAPFFGSTGGTHLNKPINGMAVTRDGQGYWLVASDGGIFTEGNALFMGSTGSMVLNRPVVGMAADPATGGYWLVASDGGIFSFGAPFFGAH